MIPEKGQKYQIRTLPTEGKDFKHTRCGEVVTCIEVGAMRAMIQYDDGTWNLIAHRHLVEVQTDTFATLLYSSIDNVTHKGLNGASITFKDGSIFFISDNSYGVL